MKELPIITGRPIARAEVIEGLREVYADFCKLQSRKERVTGFRLPDYEKVLDHIEEHGLEPKGGAL